jgi:hypothetical protein
MIGTSIRPTKPASGTAFSSVLAKGENTTLTLQCSYEALMNEQAAHIGGPRISGPPNWRQDSR